jgi:hypothetical protein
MLSDTLHSYGDLSEELGQRRFKVFPALPFVATMDSSGLSDLSTGDLKCERSRRR